MWLHSVARLTAETAAEEPIPMPYSWVLPLALALALRKIPLTLLNENNAKTFVDVYDTLICADQQFSCTCYFVDYEGQRSP